MARNHDYGVGHALANLPDGCIRRRRGGGFGNCGGQGRHTVVAAQFVTLVTVGRGLAFLHLGPQRFAVRAAQDSDQFVER